MANPTLNTLLKSYEHKKYIADLNHEKEKNDFYNSHPELSNINSKLGNLALDISKAILHGNTELANNLKSEFNRLKEDKKLLTSKLDIPKRC